MTGVLPAVVGLLVAAGLALAALVLLTTRSVPSTLGVLLDFLLAAGLLHLTTVDTWQAIGSVALVVAIRKVAVAGIGLARSSRAVRA